MRRSELPVFRGWSAFGRVALLLVVWPASAWAQVTPPGAAANKPVDALSLAAANVGIKRCLPAVTRLSSLVLVGSTGNDVLVDWDRKNADSMPFFSLSAVEYRNASLAFSLTAVPGADGSCAIAAERISVAPFTCASIAQQELQSYKAVKLLPSQCPCSSSSL